jgi:hypothetical protein
MTGLTSLGVANQCTSNALGTQRIVEQFHARYVGRLSWSREVVCGFDTATSATSTPTWAFLQNRLDLLHSKTVRLRILD